MTGIDLNRAGTPLLEIVSEPDMRSARRSGRLLRKIARAGALARICDGNMQEGSFRCDANVSVRRRGETKLGTRCEIKNLNSFRFIEQAIDFEVRAPDRADRGRRQGRAGDAALRPRPRRDAPDAQQGRRARLPLLPGPRPAAARDRRAAGSSACARRCRSCPTRCASASCATTACPRTTRAC